MLNVLLVAFLGLVLSTPALSASNPQWFAFNRAGAPNSNLQCFTPNNVAVSGGNLLIATKAETATCSSFDLPPAGYDYTSGFVAMRSFSFLYGTVEVRAKFGGGKGSGAWPVIWMADVSCQPSDPSGTDDHCNQQEIDIAEILHGDFSHANQQIHVDNFSHNDGCTAATTDTSRNFHVYQLDWSPGSLLFRIDGIVTCAIKQRYIPNTPMYLKVDTFVGGVGGRVKNDSLPWTTKIDYVRVTQGSRVVFYDDFSKSDSVRPAEQSGRYLPSPGHSLASWSRVFIRSRQALVLSVCLLLVSVSFIFIRGKQRGRHS